jgi:hypothetical protein
VDVALGGACVGVPGVLLHEALVDAAVELGGDAGVAAPVGRGGAQLLLLVLGIGGQQVGGGLKIFLRIWLSRRAVIGLPSLTDTSSGVVSSRRGTAERPRCLR